MICEDILLEAKELVAGDRHEDYGDKLVNHTRIADLWSTYLETPIRPDQVAIMMGLVKVARSMHVNKWLAMIIITGMLIYFSPFWSFMRTCPGQDDYCIWLYYEIKQEDSWLRRVLIKLGE